MSLLIAASETLCDRPKDCFLRHAGVYAIAQICAETAKDFVYRNLEQDNQAVRLAMVLVLRRWRDPQLRVALADRTAFVVEAAARAIHDLGIAAAEPDLAARIPTLTEEHTPLTHHRAVNSNSRLGKKQNARRLLAYCKKTLPEQRSARREEWAHRSRRLPRRSRRPVRVRPADRCGRG